jgi:LysM repeat protein
MKCAASFALFLGLTAMALGANSSIEFRGVMVGAGVTKLSLKDPATESTRWVEVGQTFAGYKVSAYDATNETAMLTKDGRELRLRLNAGQVMEFPAATAASPATTKLSLPQARMIFNNLRQIASAADQYYLENGKPSTTVGELVGPGKYIKLLSPVAGENYHDLKLAVGSEAVSVVTASGETVTFSDSKTSTFYHVQAGETLAQIAQATGSSVERLIELNEITDPAMVKVGQALRTK